MCFFFFKQKTAYEMLRSLVGSEMCIRDREHTQATLDEDERSVGYRIEQNTFALRRARAAIEPVSYTHLTLPTIYSV